MHQEERGAIALAPYVQFGVTNLNHLDLQYSSLGTVQAWNAVAPDNATGPFPFTVIRQERRKDVLEKK